MQRKYSIQTIRWIVASATFFVGLAYLILGPERLEYPAPFLVLHLSGVLDASIIAAIFYASIGLIIGRRRAWYFALAILGLTTLWTSIESSAIISPLSLVPAVCMVLILLTKRWYPISSAPIRISKILRGPVIFVTLITFGALLIVLLVHPYPARHATFIHAVTYTLDMMYTGNWLLSLGVPRLPAAWCLSAALSLLGAVNYTVIALGLLKPVSDYLRHTPAVRRRVKDMLDSYATSSEDYFKYFPADKAYYFGRTVHGFVAYGVHEGICVALADPIAASWEERRQLVREFMTYGSERGWLVVFLPVTKAGLAMYEGVRLKSLKIGENATINIPAHVARPLDKKSRNVENRFTKAGYSVSFVDPSDPKVIARLKAVSDSWLERGNRKEHQFAMAYFDPVYVTDCQVFAALDASRTIIAFVTLQPNYAPHQASIDMMRVGPDALPNTMDFLLQRLIAEVSRRGWKTLDLGLAPLAGLHGTRKLSERGLNVLYRFGNRSFSFQGLHRFKNKFRPEWEARYMLYSGSAARIPAIARAINELLKYTEDH